MADEGFAPCDRPPRPQRSFAVFDPAGPLTALTVALVLLGCYAKHTSLAAPSPCLDDHRHQLRGKLGDSSGGVRRRHRMGRESQDRALVLKTHDGTRWWINLREVSPADRKRVLAHLTARLPPNWMRAQQEVISPSHSRLLLRRDGRVRRADARRHAGLGLVPSAAWRGDDAGVDPERIRRNSRAQTTGAAPEERTAIRAALRGIHGPVSSGTEPADFDRTVLRWSVGRSSYNTHDALGRCDQWMPSGGRRVATRIRNAMAAQRHFDDRDASRIPSRHP